MKWMWWMVRIASWALLLAILVGISLANRAVVTLKLPFLPYEASMPLYILVVLCIGFGFVLAWVQHVPRTWRRWTEYRRTHAKLQAATNELATIRLEQKAPASIHDSLTSTNT